MTISGADANEWLAGHRPGGARFAVNEEVVIVEDGSSSELHAHVVTLARIDPEPVYLVSVASGHYRQVRQSALRQAEHH